MAEIAELVAEEAQSAAKREWNESRFGVLRDLKPIQKSKAGRLMVIELLQDLGIPASPVNAGGSTALRLPDNQLAVVKVSLRWHSGSYRFQQIQDWSYNSAFLLGISPWQVHLWIVPRDVLFARAVVQHANASRWLEVPVGAPQGWLRQYGGSLQEAADLLIKDMPSATSGAYWHQGNLLPNQQRDELFVENLGSSAVSNAERPDDLFPLAQDGAHSHSLELSR